MRVLQLRNATLLLTLGEHRFLVDPMLSPAGAMPAFRLVGERRRNPLVELPPDTDVAIARANAAIVTHEHPDHVDRPGIALLRERGLPVWTNAIDAPNLARKGLDVRVLTNGSLGMEIETIRSRHGRGLVGWMLGPVCGYFLAAPGEPSVYLVGDAILTESVRDAVARLQPDVIVAPAGSASFGVGGEILFTVDELVALAKLARGELVLNHLEAIDHCPTTRSALRARVLAEGLAGRVHVPDDGQELVFERTSEREPNPVRSVEERPGFQKWVTSFMTGT